MLHETRKRNVALGYALTRISPVTGDDNKREELQRMLHYIDPCITLQGDSSGASTAEMAKWYKETFGVPGTPEFKANIERINKEAQNNA